MAFFAHLTWQDWVTIISLVFGTVGSVIGIVAFVDQKRSARQTEVLAKWAEYSVDKKLSEEDIQKLSAQKSAMQEEVSRRIPAMARAAVLHEQVALHETAIAEHVASWQLIKNELGGETTLSGVDPQVQRAIFDRILPRHLRHERRDRLRTRVTVISVALAVMATVVPAPANGVFALLVGLPLLYTSARLFALNEEPERAFRVLRPWCHVGYLVSAIGLGGSGLMITGYAHVHSILGYAGMVLSGIGVSLLLIYVFVRRWIDTSVKLLCGTRAMFLTTRGE